MGPGLQDYPDIIRVKVCSPAMCVSQLVHEERNPFRVWALSRVKLVCMYLPAGKGLRIQPTAPDCCPRPPCHGPTGKGGRLAGQRLVWRGHLDHQTESWQLL